MWDRMKLVSSFSLKSAVEQSAGPTLLCSSPSYGSLPYIRYKIQQSLLLAPLSSSVTNGGRVGSHHLP